MQLEIFSTTALDPWLSFRGTNAEVESGTWLACFGLTELNEAAILIPTCSFHRGEPTVTGRWPGKPCHIR